MKADDESALSRLAQQLFPIETPADTLPIRGYRPPGGGWQPRAAAVLVPILEHPEPSVVLTVRGRALPSHAGQVALPGGGRLQGESFPLATALREAAEEISLDPTQVEPMGLMSRFDTISAWRIIPVVARVRVPVSLVPRRGEVQTLFRLPLADVLDQSSYRRHWIRRDGQQYEVWSMRSSLWPIWGATAAILHELATRAADAAVG